MKPADRQRMLARVRAERVSQGKSPTIDDPATLELLAALLAGGGARAASL
jgi:hypothetical protein